MNIATKDRETIDGSRVTFDVREVAALTGLSTDSIYEGARTSEIPGAIRVGRRLLFSRAAIERWLGIDA